MSTPPAVPLEDRRATRKLGQAIAAVVGPSDLVLLEGPLGAGKTFLTRAACRALGIPADVRVTSPTFTLVHEYEGRLPICHADLYRLTDPKAVFALGLLERRDQGSVLLVEWGGRFEDLLGGDALIVELSLDPRSVRLRGTGPRSVAHADAISGLFSPRRKSRSKIVP